MRILFFGIFNPEYSRNRVLIKGLIKNGIKIVQCRVDASTKFRFVKLIWEYLKMRPRYDLIFVAFPGQEAMFWAKLISRKPVILDAFTSHYGGYILDRQYFSRNSWRARYYRWLDYFSCKLADFVLLDTNAHIKFFVDEFGLPEKKFKRIFVGSDPDLFYPLDNKTTSTNFVVHFHGHFIPLQGAEHIVKAAKILEIYGIKFNIIGRGQTYKNARKISDELKVKNITFINNLDYKSLAQQNRNADISLGIFGETPKAPLVIPNKVYEAMASKSPIITADTPAARELLQNRQDCLLVPPGNSQAIADAILELRDNFELRKRIAENAYGLFIQKLTPIQIGKELINFINHAEF